MKKVVIKEDKKIEKKEEKKEEKKVVLEEVIAKKEDFVLRKQGNFFVSKKPGKYEVQFASREEDNLLELRKENHPLKMNFFGRTGRMKKAKPIQGKMKENQMTYEEIEEGMDLQYVCQEKGIKESLIIKNRKDCYDYDFEMEIGDLTPVYNEKENVLELTSNGKKIYRILSPYMEDQNHERSEACSYQIVEKGEHTLTLHLHCDETWMNDEKRAFPVIVDPTIEVVGEEWLTMRQMIDGVLIDSEEEKYILGIDETVENKVITSFKEYELQLSIHRDAVREKIDLENLNVTKDCFLNIKLEEREGFPIDVEFSCKSKKIRIDASSLKEINFDLKEFLDGESEEIIIELKPKKRLGCIPIYNQIIGPESYSFGVYVHNNYAAKEKRPALVFCLEEHLRTKDYPVNETDHSEINLMNGEYKHYHKNHLNIQQNALEVEYIQYFDSRDKSENECFMGNGWRSNFHQTLKKYCYDSFLGLQNVIYFDGKGIEHILKKLWYYLDSSGKKHYLEKKDVFLDSDQKLKANSSDGYVYEVQYEVKSEEGFEYVSGNDVTNFNQKSTQKYHYEIEFGDGKRLKEIEILEEGKVRVPQYVEILENEEIGIAFEEIDSTSMVSLITGNKVERRGVLEELFNVDDGGVFIEYLIEDTTYAKTYLKIVSDLSEYDDLGDVYVNEDIIKIDESIRYNMDHLNDIQNNCKQIFSSIVGLIQQNDYQELAFMDVQKLKEIQEGIIQENKKVSSYKRKSYSPLIRGLIRERLITLQKDNPTVFIPDNIYWVNQISPDNIIEEKEEDYLTAFNYALQRIQLEVERVVEGKQDLYRQKEKEKEDREISHSRESIAFQLNHYGTLFGQAIDEYSKQVIVIRSLQEQKQALIEEQKKQVNDFIIDQEGNALGFDGYGRLILIQDKYENKIQIEFGYEAENEGKMLSIYSDSQTIKLNYDKDTGLLSSMVDYRGQKTKYTYDENENLKSITRDNEYTYFVYSSGFKVISPLESIEIIENEDTTLEVKTYCYQGTIDDKSYLSGSESKELIGHEQYQFEKEDKRTTIKDVIRNQSVKYYFDEQGSLIRQEDDKSIQIECKSDKNHKLRANYTPSSCHMSALDIEADNLTYNFELLPFIERGTNLNSNLLAIVFTIFDEYVGQDIKFNVKSTVTYTTKEGKDYSEITEQSFQKCQKYLYYPICVDWNHASQLDIQVSSEDSSFGRELFMNIELISLDSGTLYTYDEEKRLVREQNGYMFREYVYDDKKKYYYSTIEFNIYGEKVTTKYHYNANDQLTCVEDSKQNVVEYEYDEKGNCIEKRSYNRKGASLMRVEKTSFDEHGRPSSKEGTIRDSNGCYPKEEVTYLPGTNLIRKVKGVNGETICYQYDRNSEDLLSISSSSKGINNSTVFSYNYGLLTSMSHHGVKVNYVYDGRGRKVKVLLNGEQVMCNQYDDDYQGEIKDPFQENMVISIDGSYMNSSNSIGLYVSNYQDVDGKDVLQTYSGDDSSGATKYIYDSEDRVKTIQSKIKYRVSEEYKETLTNDYDVYGNVICQEKKVNDVSDKVTFDDIVYVPTK